MREVSGSGRCPARLGITLEYHNYSAIAVSCIIYPKGKSSKTDIVQRNESWRISGGKEERNSRYLEYFRTISYATASWSILRTKE